MSDRLLNVKEASAMLGISPTTLYQWAYERRVPSVKVRGTALRFRQSALERIMREDERPALRPLSDRVESD